MDPSAIRELKKVLRARASQKFKEIEYDDDMLGIMRSVRSIACHLRRDRIIRNKISDFPHEVTVIFVSRDTRDIVRREDQNVLLINTSCIFAIKNDIFQASMCHVAKMPYDFDIFDPINKKKTLVSETRTAIYSYAHGDEINAERFFPKRNKAPNTNRRYLDIKLVFQFDKSDIRVEEYLDIMAEYKDVSNGRLGWQ